MVFCRGRACSIPMNLDKGWGWSIQPHQWRTSTGVQLMQKIKIRSGPEYPKGPMILKRKPFPAVGVQEDISGIFVGAFIGAQAVLEEIALPGGSGGKHAPGLRFESGDQPVQWKARTQGEQHMEVVGHERGAQERAISRSAEADETLDQAHAGGRGGEIDVSRTGGQRDEIARAGDGNPAFAEVGGAAAGKGRRIHGQEHPKLVMEWQAKSRDREDFGFIQGSEQPGLSELSPYGEGWMGNVGFL